MAKKVQIHIEVPEWKANQIEKRRLAKNQSKVEYLLGCADLERSVADGNVIILMNPEGAGNKTLKEIIYGQ